MQRNLPALFEGTFDLLIIGGGIFGAGVARDAALRGLRVALVDKSDFASGTSSRSSKLIHGGFRYLEQFDFGLVAESSRERRILREIAPHRVKPLPLLLPVYKNDARPLWKLRLGMTLYDLLAMYRNVAAHRTLSAREALDLEPTLRPDHLQGAILFYDCQEDDARFCIDNILHAAALGATCANYCEVISFDQAGGKIISARVRDNHPATREARAFVGSAPRTTAVGEHETVRNADPTDGQDEFDIRARVFINASGPWVERIAGFATDDHRPAPRLSPTKGAHILLPQLTQSHGVFFQGRQDSRMMFVLPWHDCTLIGTTDTDFHGDAANVHADESDIDYLLTESNTLFPQKPLTASDVITSFAGIRPLLKSDAKNPSARSRDHQILRTAENLLTLAGGKYTTYRLIAKQTVDAAYRILGQKPAKCRTATTLIPNPRPAPSGEKIADAPEVYASDIEYAVKHEMAMTVEDIMWRRAGLGLSRFGGTEMLAKIAHVAGTIHE